MAQKVYSMKFVTTIQERPNVQYHKLKSGITRTYRYADLFVILPKAKKPKFKKGDKVKVTVVKYEKFATVS